MTNSVLIRKAFLDYFERNHHKIVDSSSLIPFNDPTLLFTNAGMNQFKDVFLGREERPYRRAATSQKCMRVSGKHNDFREVGHSMRHHTFFEMLGNFSFGDYFKAEGIHFAWELVTGELGIDPKRLYITVYREDEEAYKIWKGTEGIPSERIFRLGEKDNFWAMGDTGPCGPCSELHYDSGFSPVPGHADCDLTCSCGRWVEIWNLVFMQFNRDAGGEMLPLPSPSIDTGMGLERIAAVLQNKRNNYETDLFRPLLEEIARIAGLEYGSNPTHDVSMRIIADHARAATFVVADGQYPGNDKRGYVLRKIMRRAIVHGKKLGIVEPFLFRIAGVVIEIMREAYPALVPAQETVARVLHQEEVSFADTLEQGLRDFNDRAKRLSAAGASVLPGEEAFFLYDTRGLPLEIIEDLAEESGFKVDEAAFHAAIEAQRERSRQDYHSSKTREQVAQPVFEGKTTFVGYGYTAPVRSTIMAILIDGEPASVLKTGQRGEIVLDNTPFYAEAGGQIGDTGTMQAEGGSARIIDTVYHGTAIIHKAEMLSGSLKAGELVEASVDFERRLLTMKNHTATHLLHAALQRIVGKHVKQAGSLVTPERLRFDFTHYSALSPAEIAKIEDEVNRRIWENLQVTTKVMALDDAIDSGAMALFGEKYQEQVRVVEVPGFSQELCGGTHVSATGAIGSFKIIEESGIAAGIRRLEALTGPAALERFRDDEELLAYVRSEYKVARQELPSLLEKLHAQLRDLQNEVSELKVKSVRASLDGILAKVRTIRGVNVLAAAFPPTDRASLRSIADELRQRLRSGVVILGAPQNGKAALLVMVTEDISGRLPAGRIIKEMAPLIGGAGGGKPELAEAGGKDSTRLADAIERSYSIVESLLDK